MNVLIHTPFFHPAIGGMEVLADGLARGLTNLGAVVHLVTEAQLDGSAEIDVPYTISRPPYSRVELLSMADVLLAIGPSTKLLPAARRRGVPFVLSHSAPAGSCPVGIGWRDGRRCDYRPLKCLGCCVVNQSVAGNAKSIARMHLLRWSMARAARNVYVSEALAARTPWCPGVVIGNFYDDASYRPASISSPKNEFVFLGRLVSIKGVDVLIRGFAMARGRGVGHRLVIVGDGPDRAALHRLAVAEGVAESVDFLGALRGPALAGVLQSAYALAVPSQWEEPFGIVMVEAMGSGCPVIASRRGACPEVVADAGLLVDPPGDPAAWADVLCRMAATPAFREELAVRSVARAVQHYTLRAVSTRYLEVLTAAARMTSHEKQPST